MARLSRSITPGYAHYIMMAVQQGQSLYGDEDDGLRFLTSLGEGASACALALHAYVLLPQGFRLLLTPADAQGVGTLIQWIRRRYVTEFNRRYQRSGALWQSRYRAAALAPEYILPCYCHIESQPIKTGLVADAVAYRWSSLAHHVGARVDPLVISIIRPTGNSAIRPLSARRLIVRH